MIKVASYNYRLILDFLKTTERPLHLLYISGKLTRYDMPITVFKPGTHKRFKQKDSNVSVSVYIN